MYTKLIHFFATLLSTKIMSNVVILSTLLCTALGSLSLSLGTHFVEFVLVLVLFISRTKKTYISKPLQYIKAFHASNQIYFTAAMVMVGNTEVPCGILFIRKSTTDWFPTAVMYAPHGSMNNPNSEGSESKDTAFIIASASFFKSVQCNVKGHDRR